MSKAAKSRATVICHRQDQVLLVRKPEAKWTLPGGKIEADEGPTEAALRELSEETGLAFKAIEYLALHEFGKGTHHVFRLAVADSLTARPQNEIADCRWCSVDDLGRLPVKRQIRKLLSLYCQASADEPGLAGA
ncbi:NUDIX hydrolase [Pseudomonas subflava]|uniref:NUDIX hydrolase n=1 Tax=Pseudomonas subflava TaxID=2952933 RepID=UPI0020796872|nr:NUDIX domain-containing protein [Pseudomonas subflava]